MRISDLRSDVCASDLKDSNLVWVVYSGARFVTEIGFRVMPKKNFCPGWYFSRSSKFSNAGPPGISMYLLLSPLPPLQYFALPFTRTCKEGSNRELSLRQYCVTLKKEIGRAHV